MASAGHFGPGPSAVADGSWSLASARLLSNKAEMNGFPVRDSSASPALPPVQVEPVAIDPFSAANRQLPRGAALGAPARLLSYKRRRAVPRLVAHAQPELVR